MFYIVGCCLKVQTTPGEDRLDYLSLQNSGKIGFRDEADLFPVGGIELYERF